MNEALMANNKGLGAPNKKLSRLNSASSKLVSQLYKHKDRDANKLWQNEIMQMQTMHTFSMSSRQNI